MADGIIASGPGGVALHRLPVRADASGTLAFAESGRDLPFAPQRLFWIWGVPPGAGRGRHAHRACAQFLICVSGSMRAMVETPAGARDFLLDSPQLGLHVPPMVWLELRDHTPDAVLVVLASHAFDEADYLRDRGRYLAEAARG